MSFLIVVMMIKTVKIHDNGDGENCLWWERKVGDHNRDDKKKKKKRPKSQRLTIRLLTLVVMVMKKMIMMMKMVNW